MTICKALLLWASLWAKSSALTVENQYILQLLAIDPEDPLYRERFLSIKAIEPISAVPPSSQVNDTPKQLGDRERDLFAGDHSSLIREILKIQGDRVQGKLPQPPYLTKHPRRGYHHPLALSPEGIPIEFFTFEGPPHPSDQVERVEEFLLTEPRDTEIPREYMDTPGTIPTLDDLLTGTPL